MTIKEAEDEMKRGRGDKLTSKVRPTTLSPQSKRVVDLIKKTGNAIIEENSRVGLSKSEKRRLDE